MFSKRIMFANCWQLLILGSTLISIIKCTETSQSTTAASIFSSSASSSMEEHLKNYDDMFAEESKRFFQTIPYSTGSSATSSSVSISAANKAKILKDIYRKAASEYWPRNELPPPPPPPAPQQEVVTETYLNAESLNQHYNSIPQPQLYHQPQIQSYGQQLKASNNDYLTTAFQQGYLKGKDINIQPEHKPITLHYRTHAQPIVVHQTRLPGPKPEVKHTTSHEEPQRVVHEVIRPIIQEVHEIIQPYRRVVQQVQPVIEEVRTIIAKDSGKAVAANAAETNNGPLLINNNGHGALGALGHGTSPAYNPNFAKTNQVYHASSSDEIIRKVLSPKSNGQIFRKAAVFENEEDNMIPMMTTNNNKRIIRSRVFLTPQGIPVYQSNYRAPIYLKA